jgi:hypothetical protein
MNGWRKEVGSRVSEDDAKKKLEPPVDLEQGGEITEDQLTRLDPEKVRIAPGLDGRLYLFYERGRDEEGQPVWQGFGVDPAFAVHVAAEVSQIALEMIFRFNKDKGLSN